MNRFRAALASALVAIAAAAAAQTQPSQFEVSSQPEEIDSTSQATDLRFRDDRHLRMTVPVRLSGSGPYRFLVDTGADRTAVSRSIAERLRLRKGAPATLHSVTGSSGVGTATVPMLDLSAKQLTNVEAALLEDENMGADGILGLDSLRSQRIQFDFKAQTLTIVPSRAPPRDEKGTIVVTGRKKNGRLIFTQARAEDARVTVVIDTGSEVTLGNQALRRKLERAGVLRASGPVELQSVTGQTLHGQYMFVKKLELGGVGLSDLAVVFTESHAFDQLGLADKPALLLGMNALRAFEKVSIDFASKRMRVILPEKSALEGAVMASSR